ncbi:protein serine/threonine kinase [Pelomyxa schiedti]|nr:protein serine/threonine kinase [Pelomyxa schiedti]
MTTVGATKTTTTTHTYTHTGKPEPDCRLRLLPWDSTPTATTTTRIMRLVAVIFIVVFVRGCCSLDSASSSTSSSSSISSTSTDWWSVFEPVAYGYTGEAALYGIAGDASDVILDIVVNTSKRLVRQENQCVWAPVPVGDWKGVYYADSDWLVQMDKANQSYIWGFDASDCSSTASARPTPVNGSLAVMVYNHCYDEVWVAVHSLAAKMLLWMKPDSSDDGWEYMFNTSLGANFGPEFQDAAMAPDCSQLFITDVTHRQIISVLVPSGFALWVMDLPHWTSIGGLALDYDTDILFQSVATTEPFLLAIDYDACEVVASMSAPALYFQLWPQYSCQSLSSSSSEFTSSTASFFGLMIDTKGLGGNQSVQLIHIDPAANTSTTDTDYLCTWQLSTGDPFKVDYAEGDYTYLHNFSGPLLAQIYFNECGNASTSQAGIGQAVAMVYSHCTGEVWVALSSLKSVTWYVAMGGDNWNFAHNFTSPTDNPHYVDAAMSLDCTAIFVTDPGAKQILVMNLTDHIITPAADLSAFDEIGGLVYDCKEDILYQSVADTGQSYLLAINYHSGDILNAIAMDTMYTLLLNQKPCSYIIPQTSHLYAINQTDAKTKNESDPITTIWDILASETSDRAMVSSVCSWNFVGSYWISLADVGWAYMTMPQSGHTQHFLQETDYHDCSIGSSHDGLENTQLNFNALAMVSVPCSRFEAWVLYASENKFMWFKPLLSDPISWVSVFNVTITGPIPSFVDSAMSEDCTTIYLSQTFPSKEIVKMDVNGASIVPVFDLSSWANIGGLSVDLATGYQSVENATGAYILAINYNVTMVVIPTENIFPQLILCLIVILSIRLCIAFLFRVLGIELLFCFRFIVVVWVHINFPLLVLFCLAVVLIIYLSVLISININVLPAIIFSTSVLPAIIFIFSVLPAIFVFSVLPAIIFTVFEASSSTPSISSLILTWSSVPSLSSWRNIALVVMRYHSGSDIPEDDSVLEMTPLGKLSDLSRYDKSLSLDPYLQVAVERFPLTVSPTACLDFALGTHQAPVSTEMHQIITLRNTSKSCVTFKMLSPKSHQYTLQFSETLMTLKPEEEIDIDVSLTVLCTTTINSEVIVLMINHKTEPESFILLKINLESMISPSLDHDELHLTKEVGEGAYGVVWVGSWREQEVAVKVVKNQEGKNSANEFFTEIRILESVRCPQIVHYFGAVKTPGRFAIVTEYFPLGNLHTCMQRNTFTLGLKLKCLIDCTTGMSFIHKAGLLHRDLKPDNLLVASLDTNSPVNCKITDFGTCRDINKADQTQAYTVGVGTPTYMPPELLSNGKYKQSADVYSFAVLMYQVITEKEPYCEMKSLWKITEFVLAGNRLPLDGIPTELAELITVCWDQDYHKRPSFPEVTNRLEAHNHNS